MRTITCAAYLVRGFKPPASTPGLHPRERVTPLGAPPRQHFAAVLRFHTCAESMLLVSPPYMRLKSALRQRIFSLSGLNQIDAAVFAAAADVPARRKQSLRAKQLVYATDQK